MSGNAVELERELRTLLAGTNDQRRRVGQTLYHLYRTLIFWSERGKGFLETTRLWAASGASIFDTLATSLRDAGIPRPDTRLRAYLARVWRQLAEDLSRGGHMQYGYLRWLEQQFPELTKIMKQEDVASRIFDVQLAVTVSQGLTLLAGAGESSAPDVLRDMANELEAGDDE
ncbi:MAG: hypothetical protein GY946_34205 [bacterium]|nr:hypothetical protein [bacterium]